MPYPKMTPKREDRDTFFEVLPPYIEARVDHDGSKESGMRVYRANPDAVCIQLRTYGPVGAYGGKRAGKPRPVFTSLSLDRRGLTALIAELQLYRDELPS